MGTKTSLLQPTKIFYFLKKNLFWVNIQLKITVVTTILLKNLKNPFFLFLNLLFKEMN